MLHSFGPKTAQGNVGHTDDKHDIPPGNERIIAEDLDERYGNLDFTSPCGKSRGADVT